MKKIKVALAGNPNSGKTTIFNKITSANGKVANYPGVTVEKKEGSLVYQNYDIVFVDLPGIYDLSGLSEDEIVSRKFILEEKPDLIVNIIDSSSIERSLYLTTQLLELERPLLLVCNKTDLAKGFGVDTDYQKLSSFLEVDVVESIGIKGEGILEILKAIVSIDKYKPKGALVKFSEETEKSIDMVKAFLENDLAQRWKAIKLLEKDPSICKEADKKTLAFIESINNKRTFEISSERQQFIKKLTREVVKRSFDDKETMSDKIDRIVTNKYLGLPIFLLLMFLMFQTTFALGSLPTKFLQIALQKLSFFLSSFWDKDSLLSSLLVDGILSGVGSVISFFPNIFFLFIALSFLEESGYMARAAYVTDRLMHKIGLHGKSFIPMLIGFGCTVPAIMASRILENKRDRLIIILVLPLFACSAKLAVFSLLIPAFFTPFWGAVVLFSLYVIGLGLAIVFIKLLRKTLFKGESIPFIMEMPPFQVPSFKNIFFSAWEKAAHFIKKAGTFIFGVCVLLWFLSKFPIDQKAKDSYEEKFSLAQTEMLSQLNPEYVSSFKEQSERQKYSKNFHLDLGQKAAQVKDLENKFNNEIEKLKLKKSKRELSHSYLGRVGRALEPVFKPLGFDSKIDLALLSSLPAKEIFISQLGILFAINDNSASLHESLKNNYSPLVGFCVLLFLLISAPCIATFSAAQKETNLLFAILQFFTLTLLAYLVTFIFFQLGSVL